MTRKAPTIRWVVPLVSCAILVGAAGLATVIARAPGAVFIAGDQPVSEDQVRNKLRSDGWTDVRITHEGQLIQATGLRDGQTQKLVVDARNGRLRDDDDDDD